MATPTYNCPFVSAAQRLVTCKSVVEENAAFAKHIESQIIDGEYVGDLRFIAATAGAAGNALSIECVQSQVESLTTVVSTNGAVVITLAADANGDPIDVTAEGVITAWIAASLTNMGVNARAGSLAWTNPMAFVNMVAENADLTFVAQNDGGEGTTVTITKPATYPEDFSVEVASVEGVYSDDITVNLAVDAGVAATKTINGIVYTAMAEGAAGNTIDVTLVAAGAATPTTSAALGVDNAVTVTLAVDAELAIIATRADVVSALYDDIDVAALLYATAAAPTGLAVANLSTALAGGRDGVVTTTADDIAQGIMLSEIASNYVTVVTEGDGSGVVDDASVAELELAYGAYWPVSPFDATFLAGGVDAVGCALYDTVNEACLGANAAAV